MTWRDTRTEIDQVSAFMRELAALPLDAPPPPDPALLWWKAQMIRRWDAEQQAGAPIDVGERVQVGIGFAGVAALLGWLWRSAPAAFGTTAMMLVGVTILAAATAAALTVWSIGARD